VFGRDGVSLNGYQNEDRLNSMSCNLSTDPAIETIQNISGGLNLGLRRHAAARAAATLPPRVLSERGKPGTTGAQVNGERGETDTVEKMRA
jgi:hypothetical protein